MIETLAYGLIFFLTFAMVAVAAGLAWMMVERSSKTQDQEPSLLRSERLSALAALATLLERVRLAEKLRKLLAEAGLSWSVGRLTLQSLVAGSLALAVLIRFDWVPVFAAFGVAAAVAAAPLYYVRRIREKRLQDVEDQLPELLDFISRALVAGHSLPLAMELAADEIGAPLSGELRKAVDEYNLGKSLDESLESLAVRLPSVDIRFFVSAVMAQTRSGGSLHDLLDGLAETIRERATLKGQVRALTANGRITAIILTLLPFLIAGVMFTFNSSYFDALLDNQLGKTLIFFGLCGQAAAFFVIHRIVDIKV